MGFLKLKKIYIPNALSGFCARPRIPCDLFCAQVLRNFSGLLRIAGNVPGMHLVWTHTSTRIESYKLNRQTGAEMQHTRIWCKLGVTPPSSSKTSVAFLLQPLDDTANKVFCFGELSKFRFTLRWKPGQCGAVETKISPCGEMSRGAWWKGSAQTRAMEGHTDNRLFEGNMNVSALKEMPRDMVPFFFFF